MITLDGLYKRNANGSIESWFISVSDNKVTRNWGKIDGKIQQHTTESESKNVGKSNETSPEQQALLDAQSEWNKQKDKGYKSLKDLNILQLYNENNLIDLLNKYLPKENTDALGNVKPMLAQSVKKDFSNITFPCFIQPKLDGVRCLMIVDRNSSNEVTFLSRNGKEYTTLNHIAEEINQVQGDIIPNQFILDGEIYSHKITFQEIVSAVKKENENTHKLKFRCYDIVNNEKQINRFDSFNSIVNSINSKNIIAVETSLINTKEEAEIIFLKYIEQGYEGAMLRNLKGLYQSGFRTKDLLKYKEFDETEFEFIIWKLGERGVEDLIALCKTKEGKEFNAKMAGNKNEKIELYDTLYPLGSLMTIKHFGYTNDNLPRFPIGKGIRFD